MLTVELQAGARLGQWHTQKDQKLSSRLVYCSRIDFTIILLVNAPKGNLSMRMFKANLTLD